MFQEKPSKMSRSDTQALGQSLDAAVVERAFAHEPRALVKL